MTKHPAKLQARVLVGLTVCLSLASGVSGRAGQESGRQVDGKKVRATEPGQRRHLGPGPVDLRAGEERGPAPDPATIAKLAQSPAPSGDWGGSGCPATSVMRGIVDTYLATPHPDFPSLGSPIPGLSTSWSSADCGVFTYAAGLRRVEDGKPMTPATLMSTGSMTKPVIAAMTLMLNDAGLFGPAGLDTTVDRLLTTDQIRALTVGDDPAHPACPGATFLYNRETGEYEWTAFSCPDLSRVTLRHLMLSNHGMYDFLNEVLADNGFWLYDVWMFYDLYRFFGFTLPPPPNSIKGFDYLKAIGLKRVETAVVGGNSIRDLEVSEGNTGFQLLGIILEHQTGTSLDALMESLIVRPLGIDDMFLYLDPVKRRNRIADAYTIHTGNPTVEIPGLYPILSFNGHTAINTLSEGFGRPATQNHAGGAGALMTTPKGYRAFLDAFVNGGLLSPAAQAELNASFLDLPDVSDADVAISNGYGLIRQKVRNGFGGLPDIDILTHGGSLFGAHCENIVMSRVDGSAAPVTGVACKNQNFDIIPANIRASFLRALVAAQPQP